MRKPRFVAIESLESRQMFSALHADDASATLAAVVNVSKLPSTVVAGQPINRLVNVNVINQTGLEKVQGFAFVQVFASADGVVDESSVQLASRRIHVNLRAGFSDPVRLLIKSTPVSLAAGPYTLLAEVTDPSDDSSSSTFGPSVQVAAPVVSLANLSIGKVTPQTIKLGKAGNVAITVSNEGNVASTGTAAINLFLATDGQPASTPFATLTPTLKIPAGHSRTIHLHFVMPTSQTPGSYALFVSVGVDGSSASALGQSSFVIAG